MGVRITILAEIPKENDINKVTLYFFSKKKRIVLPIEINVNKFVNDNSNIYSTFVRTLRGYNISLEKILIYHSADKMYYSYLFLHRNNQSFEINCSFQDSYNLARIVKCPIYVKENILNTHGIYVNRELLTNSLAD